MVAKAMHEHAARIDAGIDVQVLVGELVDHHDPYERALLNAAYAAAIDAGDMKAADIIGRLILINKREDNAHLTAHKAARVMTGHLSGVGEVKQQEVA